MRKKTKYKSYFSVSSNLILTEQLLPYDLFVNSSSLSEKEKFVRIFPGGEYFTSADLQDLKKKYHQLYVPEEQRSMYLKSLVKNNSVPDASKTEIIKSSAIHYLDTLFDKDKEFTTEVLKETIQGCRDSVESMVDIIQDYNIQKIQDLIGSLSFHDFYTYDHSINVAMYSIGLYKTLNPNATQTELVEVGMGGLLHDLGKIKIPNEIINNPGKLTDKEFAEIRKHPGHGVKLMEEGHEHCAGLNIDTIKRVILEHHENFNGTGYPLGLEGSNIHLYARITAIADFFDALTTKRSYHEVLSVDEALSIMSRSKGKKIDPKLFDVFVQQLKKFVPQGKSKIELPDDFDPCQPQNELPFQNVKEEHIDKDFGKIKADLKEIFSKQELSKAGGKIKLVDPNVSKKAQPIGPIKEDIKEDQKKSTKKGKGKKAA